jgi:hypothetical protein
MHTFLAVDPDSLAEALRKATPADVIHTAFPPLAHYPRLIVSGEHWTTVSRTSIDTNGRWTWRGGKLDHRPSLPDPEALKYPETKVG